MQQDGNLQSYAQKSINFNKVPWNEAKQKLLAVIQKHLHMAAPETKGHRGSRNV